MATSPTEQRLAALREYEILDTRREASFDALAELASTLCRTPMGLISLLDDHRQWFKSAHGLCCRETPIDQAFCRFAIRGDDVMVVPDALADQRFAGNPLVTGEPFIRAYAGAPLITPTGVALGTLCVLDREARTFGPEMIAALRALAGQVVQLLELRRVSAALHGALLARDEAQDEVRQLRKLLPICAYCRDVRDDQDYWEQIDHYLARREGFTFSHGVCPRCYPRMLEDMDLAEPNPP